MKKSIVSLMLVLASTSFAGISSEGGGTHHLTAVSCGTLSPIAKGRAEASLAISKGVPKIYFGNVVNDFEVSFDPIEVIANVQDTVSVSVQGDRVVAQADNQDLKMTIKFGDFPDTVTVGKANAVVEYNGTVMSGTCQVTSDYFVKLLNM